MGFVFNRQQPPRQNQRLMWGITSVGDLVPRRTFGPSIPMVTHDSAFNHSAVWAAVRLRADMISTLPVCAYRNIVTDPGQPDFQVSANLSPFMASPDFMEWRYSSQVELDRSGNSIGIIMARNAVDNYPSEIKLVPSSAVTLVYKDGVLRYRINNILYNKEDIWHEKQYTVSGCDMGLSPVMHAAWNIGQYQSIQNFITDWFVSGATPRARLKNTAKRLNPKEATIVKEAWRASQIAGEPFVHGADWEYDLMQNASGEYKYLENIKLSLEDAARFFGVPADMIDAQMNSPNITYANITQRNLQFLILHLGPAIARRENAWSQLLPRPRYAELDTTTLLRMDPETRANWIRTQIEARVLAPNEARAMDNRLPFTTDQIEEFNELGLNRRGSTPATSLAPVPVDPSKVNAEYVAGEITTSNQGTPP